jgi:hypothetical protein
VRVISAPRRWAAAVLLVSVGWLVTPEPMAVYDGVGQPDEPYRYVSAPAGAKKTAGATEAVAHSPVSQGHNTNGMSMNTAEQGPQLSLFIPAAGLASPGRSVEVRAVPQAPTDQPKGGTIDGNVYLFTITDKAGPVTFTEQSALATLALRATSPRQPGPVVVYRGDPEKPWTMLQTARGGADIYVSNFPGAGQYAMAYMSATPPKRTSPLPYVLLGGLVLLVVVIVVIRLQAKPE